MVNFFDHQLSGKWNEVHLGEKVFPEQFWDLCRQLSEHDILQPDRGAVSAFQIGPFNVATRLEVKKKDLLTFFIESVFPAILTETTQLTFQEAYPMYIVPAIKVLIYLLDSTYFIRDTLQWTILIYIKRQNEMGIFPTIDTLKNQLIHLGNNQDIQNAIDGLSEVKSCAGDTDSLILISENGQITSLV